MKKIFFYLPIFLLLVNCAKDTQEEKPTIEPAEKALQPTAIIVKQGDEIVKDAVKEGKITLEQGKNYRVNVTFAEDVELQKGEFLKMKAKSPREFYADFYGKNANEISEKVIFKKEGYKDFSLEIIQEQLVSKNYSQLEIISSSSASIISGDDDKKTIWILNIDKDQPQAEMKLTFLTPVVLENPSENGQNLVNAEAQEEGTAYQISVNSEKLIEKGTLILPIYASTKMQKGKQVGEIVFKPETAPYYFDKNKYTPQLNVFTYTAYDQDYNDYDEHNYQDDENDDDDSGNNDDDNEDDNNDENEQKRVLNVDLQLFFNGEKQDYVFIDNANQEWVETYQSSTTEKGKITIKLKEDTDPDTEQKLHFFDAYQGELKNGQIVKKQGATKREIIIHITGY
ncbi:hypothetical protein [Capnocytophaga sp.]|uniref:hypothetical protein n=1 Tax=Capnocytophaga sp. TaxID=44737 RepID=UPI0026DAD1EF|nr:hypothetical protein [Capnocytophaga sp.]MDO5105981.1 hypothetical protein [Capnocytophaga sp.]